MRRTVLSAAAVALALAGCSSSASTPAPASGTLPTSVAGPATPADHASTASKPGVGAALDLKIPAHAKVPATTIRITLVKVVDPSKPANPYDEIPGGKRQVAFQLQILNTGKIPYESDPENRVRVHDTSGQSFAAELTSDTTAGPAMDTGLNLAPGDTALGFVTANLPNDSKIATVEYNATPFGGDAARWTIG